MSLHIYVIDTSYLIEIAGCGRDSNPVARDNVRGRFFQANKNGGRFFVPLPCLFELGDHIADVGHEVERGKLARWLVTTVRSCLDKNQPWIITPAGPPHEILPELLRRFEPLAEKQKVGLVDTFTAAEADRLKDQLAMMKAQVHIWTNDRNLKKLEPDAEHAPYLWG